MNQINDRYILKCLGLWKKRHDILALRPIRTELHKRINLVNCTQAGHFMVPLQHLISYISGSFCILYL